MKSILKLCVVFIGISSCGFCGETIVRVNPPTVEFAFLDLLSSNATLVATARKSQDNKGVRYVLPDVYEGVHWLALQSGVGGLQDSYLETYKIDFNKETELLLELPRDRVVLDLDFDTEKDISGIFLKLQKYDGDELDPIFNRLRKLYRDQREGVFFLCKVPNVQLGREYLLTFLVPTDGIGYKTTKLVSVRITFKTEDIQLSFIGEAGSGFRVQGDGANPVKRIE